MRDVESNFEEYWSRVIDLVEKSPLAKYGNYETYTHLRKDMDHAGDLSIEYRRASTRCSLYVRMTSYLHLSDTRHTNSNGDEYVMIEPKVETNWPCHGSCDPATSLARLRLYMEVAQLAADVAAELQGQRIWTIWQTNEEKEESKRRQNQAARERVINKIFADHCKGLRVNGRIASSVTCDIDIPTGVHTLTNSRANPNDKKSYVLEVTYCAPARTGQSDVFVVGFALTRTA
jgi:hypothetical protein